MSEKLIARSPDLQKLRDEGFSMEIRDGYLFVHSVPYVAADRQIHEGIIITDLTLSGERTTRPNDHQVWFVGQFPCTADGRQLNALGLDNSRQVVAGVQTDFRFSNKPPEGYSDYYEKVSRYVQVITDQARAIDPQRTAQLFKPVRVSENESVFHYYDTASTRAGIEGLSQKLAMDRVAIIGLGGTGSYVLDLLAKTHVKEIHLFDGDAFLQHNAFRSPGAATFDELDAAPSKVDYFSRMYSGMRRGVVPHNNFILEENVADIDGFSFIFVCVDTPRTRGILFERLIANGTPFIDVGMELELLDDEQQLIGACRYTMATKDKSEHLRKYVSTAGDAGNNIYRRNIQTTDINALNAALAVIRWKRYCGFYQDSYSDHQSAYVINTHQLTRDETS